MLVLTSKYVEAPGWQCEQDERGNYRMRLADNSHEVLALTSLSRASLEDLLRAGQAALQGTDTVAEERLGRIAQKLGRGLAGECDGGLEGLPASSVTLAEQCREQGVCVMPGCVRDAKGQDGYCAEHTPPF